MQKYVKKNIKGIRVVCYAGKGRNKVELKGSPQKTGIYSGNNHFFSSNETQTNCFKGKKYMLTKINWYFLSLKMGERGNFH